MINMLKLFTLLNFQNIYNIVLYYGHILTQQILQKTVIQIITSSHYTEPAGPPFAKLIFTIEYGIIVHMNRKCPQAHIEKT